MGNLALHSAYTTNGRGPGSRDPLFSESELLVQVRYMLSQIRLSVCLSLTLVRPTQAVELFGNFFTIR